MLDLADRPTAVHSRTFSVELFYPQNVVAAFFSDLARVRQTVEYWQAAYMRNEPLRVLLSAAEEEALRSLPTMRAVFNYLDTYEADNYPRHASMERVLSFYVDLYPY